jgi:hypothetical protein
MNKTLTGRMVVTYLAIKYHNNWPKIYSAIKNKELVDEVILRDVLETIKGKYVCIIDADYPDSLKKVLMPPFVVFLDKRDRNLISDEYSDRFLEHFESFDAKVGA